MVHVCVCMCTDTNGIHITVAPLCHLYRDFEGTIRREMLLASGLYTYRSIVT